MTLLGAELASAEAFLRWDRRIFHRGVLAAPFSFGISHGRSEDDHIRGSCRRRASLSRFGTLWGGVCRRDLILRRIGLCRRCFLGRGDLQCRTVQKRKPFSQAANEYQKGKQNESGTYPSYTALLYWRNMTCFFFVARSLSSLASLGSRAAEVRFWPRVPDRPLPLPRREAEGASVAGALACASVVVALARAFLLPEAGGASGSAQSALSGTASRATNSWQSSSELFVSREMNEALPRGATVGFGR